MLERIWIKRRHRGPMDERPTATLVAEAGLVDSADQGGRRQVTLLALEAWDATARGLGVELDPILRRANLLISGIDLVHTRGRTLAVGKCRLCIEGETRPCERMDEAQPGLQTALESDWRGGVFASVMDSGTLRVGDPVRWID